jgi:hypothetical protein
MKRAKMMLSVIAVVAVVGGALAFKAKDSAILSIYTPDEFNTTCTFSVQYQNATIAPQSQAITTLQNATITRTSDETKCAAVLYLKNQ